jgi:hypothetical protein
MITVRLRAVWRPKVHTDLRTERGDGVELTESRSPCPWRPVLECRLLAGFQLSTEDHRSGVTIQHRNRLLARVQIATN